MTRPLSYAPIVIALGVMLTLWGVASTWILSVVGLLIIAIGVTRWWKEVRHEK